MQRHEPVHRRWRVDLREASHDVSHRVERVHDFVTRIGPWYVPVVHTRVAIDHFRFSRVRQQACHELPTAMMYHARLSCRRDVNGEYSKRRIRQSYCVRVRQARAKRELPSKSERVAKHLT